MAVELNDPHTVGSEQGLVADGWKIVAGKPKGELRRITDSCFIKVPCGNTFAARELLDYTFVQFPSIFTLRHCYKPLSLQ